MDKLQRAAFAGAAAIPVLLALLSSPAYAGSAANLYVSAANPAFDNHFAGSMVVEVVVSDGAINDLDDAGGEPDVTLNGKSLRMVQAADGSWYAYFANVDRAKAADQASLDGGMAGQGLDFGVFCGRDTAVSVLGADFSDTDGIAIPGSAGIAGFTNGESPLSACTGELAPGGGGSGGGHLNNVVRKAKPINTNANVPPGQIGLDSDAWPLIQLFSFGDVSITYNPGGRPPQTVDLEYDRIPNIAAELDRDVYPPNSEVFVTIYDMQLNQDPTDGDSWTFGVGDTAPATFYQAFTNAGADSANGGTGLVNLAPDLDGLGFDENGLFGISTGPVVSLGTNGNQPSTFVSDGTATYSEIVTFVETGPNTGVFETSDDGDDSVIGIIDGVPRGISGHMTYNGRSASVLSGFSTASISTGPDPAIALSSPDTWRPGTEIPISITDPDQNLNSGARDALDLYRSTAVIPTITINDPVTLGSSSDVRFYESSTTPLPLGTPVSSAVPDRNSARLLLDTTPPSSPAADGARFEKISVNLGVSASQLGRILVDNSGGDSGTNWINYDLRSIQRQLELGGGVGDTSMALYFGSLSDAAPVAIADPGDLRQLQGLVEIDDDDVAAILARSGTAFLVINFDDSDDSDFVARVSGEDDRQPIVFDIFSFGIKDGRDTNNSVYRLELEESSDDSGIFAGTLEYAVANQLDITTPDLIETLRPIGDEIKFVVTGRMLDEEGISISYSDMSGVGNTVPVASKSSVLTASGTVSTDAASYGFGQPVTITLDDPDLNLDNDRIDVYTVIDDPDSENVDAVGGAGGQRLLEVEIKGTKYKRCTVGGVDHGGLASTGFALVETGPGSGVFEGVFKMPSRICNDAGTGLAYTSGGNIGVRYFDFRDSSGGESIVTLSGRQTHPPSPYQTIPQLSVSTVDVPKHPDTRDVVLTGKIDGHRRGTPVGIALVAPDGSQNDFAAYPTGSGSYRAVFSISSDSDAGQYRVHVHYQDAKIGTASFHVSGGQISEAIRNDVKDWSRHGVPDSSFREAVRDLADQEIIDAPGDRDSSLPDGPVPAWIKDASGWWIDGLISDGEYLKALEFLVKKGIIRI